MKLPTPSIDCENAWLSPSGDCYPNPGYAWHSSQAAVICQALGIDATDRSHRGELIHRGWAFLRDNVWHMPDAEDRIDEHQWERLTNRQFNTIFDWYELHGKPLPSFLAPATAPEAELAMA
jgi:hypothetical protein